MPECESRRSTVQITAAETMDVGRKIKMENTAAKVMNEHMHTIEYLLNEITSDNLTISDNVQQP